MTQPNKSFFDVGGFSVNDIDYDLPENSTFIEAWAIDEGSAAITVNMEKAREIWRDKIRRARGYFFSDLDAEYMKLLEMGEDTSEVVARKQALRDAPSHPDIDTATTVEELIAVQPISGHIIMDHD